MSQRNFVFQELEELLISAVENGDHDLVTSIIEQGADVNYSRRDGTTPLITAVSKGDVAMVSRLLDNGSNVNHVPLLDTNQYGDSALHVAAMLGNLEVTRILFQHKADASVSSFGRRTPLMKSCLHGNLDVTKELVANGADPNHTDYQLMSGFIYACSKGQQDICAFLLQRGADIDLQNWKGETGLILAVKNNHLPVAKLLLSEHCDVDRETLPQVLDYDEMPGLSTALHVASRDGSVRMCRALLQHGAHVNHRNDRGLTPLHYACGEGHLNVVQFLLSQNCDINGQSRTGKTALHKAVLGKHSDVVQMLLKHNANPNIPSVSGTYPLTRAISLNAAETVKILIQSNCDVQVCEKFLLTNHTGKKTKNLIKYNKQSARILWMLLLAGCNMETVQRLVTEKYSSSPTSSAGGAQRHRLPAELEMLREPCLSLKYLCRVAVRRTIGHAADMREKVLLLGLPVPVQHYILLAELNF